MLDILQNGRSKLVNDIRIVHNTNTGGITIYTPKSKINRRKMVLNKNLLMLSVILLVVKYDGG